MENKKKKFDIKTLVLVKAAETFVDSYKDAIIDAYVKVFTNNDPHEDFTYSRHWLDANYAEMLDALVCLMYEVYDNDEND